MNRPHRSDPIATLVSVAVLAFIVIASLATLSPPRPLPRDAAPAEFSADRAYPILQMLVAESVPHPTGSAQNAAIRERIVGRLQQLGYSPRVESKFVCGIYASCATVTNVVAELPGERSDAVVLASHYDSVPAGPGASDDALAVSATLEIARAMRAMPRPKRGVILLIDDGEEAGLLGASAFVDTPDAKRVAAVVNEESRGTSGPSLMFETSSGNEAIIRAFARAARRPIANSLYYAFYKRMPNNTDLTVFKDAKLRGLNFAFIGDVARYHTPEDDLAHVTRATLQHHGDNALGMLRELAWNDAPVVSTGDAVYFDLFGRALVFWPAAWNPILVVIAAVVFLAAFVVARRRGSVSATPLVIAFAVQLLAIVATAAVGFGLLHAIRAAGIATIPFIAFPSTVIVAFWALPLVVMPFTGWLFRNRCSREEMTFGSVLVFLIGSIATTFVEPSAAFIFIPAAVVLAFALLAATLITSPRAFDAAAILASATAAVPLIPISLLLYTSLGTPILPGIALILAIVLSPLLAIVSHDRFAGGWRLSAVALVIAAVALIVAAFRPPFSDDSPRPLNLQYVESPRGRPEWVTSAAFGPLPPGFGEAANWRLEAIEGLPAYRDSNRFYVADAPRVNMPAPRLDVVRAVDAGAGKRRLTLHASSARNAPILRLIVNGEKDVSDIDVGGQRVGEVYSVVRNAWEKTNTVQVIVQPPPDGIDVTFTIPIGKTMTALLMDESYGLPPQAADLVRRRPRASITRQDGDTTVIMREITIPQ